RGAARPGGGGCVTSLRAARRIVACRQPAQPLAAFVDMRPLFVPSLLAAVSPLAGFAQGSRVIAAVDSEPRIDREGSVLARLVTVQITDMPLGLALHLIAQEGHLRLSYSSDVVPGARRVSVARDRTPVGDVLRDVLAGTNVDPIATPSGYVVLVRSLRPTFTSSDSS